MSSPIEKAIEHARANRDQYLAGYHDLLRIPSVSTDPAYKADLERCADWIVAEMTRIGLKNCRKMPTDGHSMIYGEWLEAGDDKPTVLVYSHYDVQPVDPLDLWQTPPFEPTVRDGKLYARGSSDNKNGVWGNLKTFESILATEGRLPVNVKVLFEGEEETASPSAAPFVNANRELLRADALMMSDSGFDPDNPVIGYTARGIISAEVVVRGPDHDLHSGGYGGVVHNPLHMVGKIIGSFHDEAGRVQIPDYYDQVGQLDDDELAQMMATYKITGPEYEAKSGVEHFWGESIASIPERATALPTLDVNGITGGYQGPGMKTVIPSETSFKVTMRLVADQDPAAIAQLFTDYVQGFACDTMSVEVNILDTAWPVLMAEDGPSLEAAQRAFEAIIGRRARRIRIGGSIPILGMFQRELAIPITPLGFGSGENIHSPNEYLNLDHFFLSIEKAIHCYYYLAETMG